MQNMVNETPEAKKPKKGIDMKLKQEILNAIESGLFNKKQLAAKAGYSSATISQYLNNEYPGDIEKLESALRQCISFQKSSIKYEKINLQFSETSVSKDIFNAAKTCRLNGEIGICYGASGLGKTMSINQYAKENSGVYVIDPNECATAKNILQQLSEKLKLACPSTKTGDLMNEAVKKLKDSNFLIIVDESENLAMSVFRALRKIHDRCNFTFGLLFVGTKKLWVNLKNLRGDFTYLVNRIAYMKELNVLNMSDIEMLTRQVFPNADIETLNTFKAACENNGRLLFNILKRARDLSITTGDDINSDMVIRGRDFIFR